MSKMNFHQRENFILKMQNELNTGLVQELRQEADHPANADDREDLLDLADLAEVIYAETIDVQKKLLKST